MSTEAETEELGGYNLRFGKYVVKRLDLHNIVVQEMKVRQSGEGAGSEYPVNLSFHKRLADALNKVLRFGVEKKLITDITNVITALDEAEANMHKVLKENYKDFDKSTAW